MTIKIQLAGYVARITSKYHISTTVYADFRTDSAEDFYISLTDRDIDFTPVRQYSGNKVCIKAPCILKKMADSLIEFDVLLMHGAIIALNSESYMFTAVSGTGKTTHILKWLENCSDAFVVNGDKPFIRFGDFDTQPVACGSPWAGKENLYTNSMVPLKSIILMERADENRIQRIPFTQAVPSLLQQVDRPEDVEKMRKTIQLFKQMEHTVSFWRFQCNNFKDDCFNVAFNALVRDSKQ